MQKHALFGPNRVFLVISSGSSTSTTRRIIEPEKFHLEVENPRDVQVLDIVRDGQNALESISNLGEAGSIFARTYGDIGLHGVAEKW